MNLPAFSVRRPVFTSMVTLIVVVLGVVAFDRLLIDFLPRIELPTVSIDTRFEGASPEVMESQITQIIEEIVATVPGVEEITSESSEGRSRVTVRFAWGTNIDSAALELQATLEDEINELPDDITRPRVSKFDINSFPVVLLGISSNLPPVELTELIENQIRYRFARVPGVAQVDLWGGYDREVRIELDPDRVMALSLPMDQILTALRSGNLDLPSGRIEDGRYEVTLRAPAQFTSLDEIRDTVILRRPEGTVRIGDVAEVRDTYEKLTRMVRINGEPGIRVAIRKQASANTVEVSRAVLAQIGEINRDFPQIAVVPVLNQGNFIERSIANVARSVLYGGGLAIFVLLFFLRNVPSTIVISLSIPISIIATFALIFFGGFTLNLMTLGGLALGVGMMVDSSIVVLENIFRRRDENGEAPMLAAAEGAREVGPAIIASTITTLVIFLPLAFVRGVSGVLFQELAYVIVFALVCSLFVSLSIVPMLASRMLRPKGYYQSHRSPRVQRLADWADRIFRGLDTRYQSLLYRVLERRGTTVLVSLAVLGLSLLLLPRIGSEFLPPSDEGEVRVYGNMEEGTRLALVDAQTRLIEEIVYPAVPEAVATVATARSGRADISMSLVPASQRTRSNLEIAEDLRQRLEGQIPGMEVRTRAPQGQFLLGRLIGGDGGGLSIEVRGYDLEIMEEMAAAAAEAIAGVPGVTDVERRFDEGIPQESMRIDRQKVADLGLTVRDVTEVLRTAIAGSQAGEYRAEGNSYRILVQLKDAEQRSIDDVLNLTLSTASGELVALRNLVTSTPTRAPREIDRKEQQRIITVQVNVAGRAEGTTAGEIRRLLERIPRPDGYSFIIAGSYAEQQEAFRELMIALLLALLLVYMVLACQYESFRNPLIVMTATPMAAIGVILTLVLTDTTLNLQSAIGCIMLGGIVVNNAILLVDQASRLHVGEHYAVHDAVAEAGRRRLRPILMTTLTTILGLLPLALGLGEGSEAQAPLARAVVGGLLGSTLITLVLTPVVYSLFHSSRAEGKASA